MFAYCIQAQQRKGPGGALGPPNKEQNWENKEQNGGKKLKIRPSH